jgi:hypothetical protein
MEDELLTPSLALRFGRKRVRLMQLHGNRRELRFVAVDHEALEGASNGRMDRQSAHGSMWLGTI